MKHGQPTILVNASDFGFSGHSALRLCRALLAAAQTARAAYRRKCQRRREIAILRGMSARQLADIGLTRADIMRLETGRK